MAQLVFLWYPGINSEESHGEESGAISTSLAAVWEDVQSQAERGEAEEKGTGERRARELLQESWELPSSSSFSPVAHAE